MVLQGVIRKMLFSFSEHHAIDLGGSPSADQGHVLIDFGQSTAQRTNRRIDRMKQIATQQVAMILQEIVEAAKQHALLAILFSKTGANRPAVDGRGMPRQFDALAQQSFRHYRIGRRVSRQAELIELKE